jgi:acetyl esterase/lipase
MIENRTREGGDYMKKQWLTAALLLSMMTGGIAMAAPQKNTAHVPSKVLNVTVTRPKINQLPNVVYEQVPARGYPSKAMTMDLLIPQKKEKMPLIVYVPGGGFISANKNNMFQICSHLAEAGYVVAAVEYRVAPSVRFPAPLEDVKAAVRYLKAHADTYSIDANRVGVIGGSAGGYLTALMATTSGTKTFDKGENLDQNSNITCAVDLYGISDLTKIGADYSDSVQALHKSSGATEALWVNGSGVFGGKDGGINADQEAAEKANPIHYISKSSAPMLLMHGTADTVVSPSQTDLLFQALQQKGIASERYEVPGAPHGGEYWIQEPVLNLITSYFDRYLKG